MLLLFKMTILNLKIFLKEDKLKDIIINESDLKKSDNYPICSRDSIINTNKGFINIEDGNMGGKHWTCFFIKDKSFYFDSFGGAPDKSLINQLTKPITCHKYKIQDLNSRICGVYNIKIFYLVRFGSTSVKTESEIDLSLFVQKRI